jgi:cellulose synthase/poly-beta-1,6-N-acetylglucosamine synthase-like glycosyltransferase
MGGGVGVRAAVGRAREVLRESASDAPSLAPALETHSAELDCVCDLLPGHVIAAAYLRALEIGVSAERVLIVSGALDEETYLRALADYLGVLFEPLDDAARTLCPLSDARLIETSAAGLVPFRIDNELCVVVAPRGAAVRKIIRLIENRPKLAHRFRFTTSERLQRFVFRHANSAIGERAARSLAREHPQLSAAPPRRRSGYIFGALFALAMLTGIVFAPSSAILGFELVLAGVFISWMAMRLGVGAFIAWPQAAAPRIPDSELPVYTIVAALYREAASVNGLLSAIERFDYPPEKLDVKLIVERNDEETREAILTRPSKVPIEVIVAPPAGPRTKPKALNVALPFAQGGFLVVYDAEDRPEATQLRTALNAFRAADNGLACVQACLSIDNTSDSWLARYYTAEYAGQFDVFLPGIAALGLPLPLGGSSNHFRAAALREAGGWDPYNVTEDADLGMRLARFGYRTGVIDSTTYEEAPSRIGAWLRQRSRWFKGWMQTWLVHMRNPRQLWRELGVAGFLAFQLMVGGNVLAALVHPLFMGALLISAITGDLWDGNSALIAFTTLTAGYFVSALLGGFGLMRRGLLAHAWVLLLTPLHWLLLSLAAWRALYQLIAEPYRWEKTEHGLAKSSRRAKAVQALFKLERYLSWIGAESISNGAKTTYSAADRPRTPRAAA